MFSATRHWSAYLVLDCSCVSYRKEALYVLVADSGRFYSGSGVFHSLVLVLEMSITIAWAPELFFVRVGSLHHHCPIAERIVRVRSS